MMKSALRESSVETTSSQANERRTIIVERHNGSFGFTLQSYGIHYRQSADLEIITYVDYVDPNGCAQRAGLKSGDVIVSINGQEVERVDHATLVAIIQSCPDRIRMIVVFENCVRKVELHMKYIRLKRKLEAKAREYQEVCFSERSFIARLNKTRGSAAGSNYHTIQSSSHMAMRRQATDQISSSTSASGQQSGSYSSKSMPRSQSHHHPEAFRQYSYTPTATDVHPIECHSSKQRRNYLPCISQPADCTCCFTKDEADDRRNTITQVRQRPRSFYLPNCYNPNVADSPSDVVADEQFLIRPDHKAYGGYGFGYDYPVQHQSPHRVSSGGGATASAVPIRRSVNENKSTEDLLLADQMQSQCHIPPNYQSPARHQANLESIAFYKRPSLPVAPSTTGHYRNYQRQSTANKVDDGGYNQIRSSRKGTLPKQHTTEK